LWELNRDEIIATKFLKEIDLISVEPDPISSSKLGAYKIFFQFLCHTDTLRKPIPSFNFKQWQEWQERLKGAKIWIFEAKSAKGDISQAIGQVLTYKELFRKDYPETEIVGYGIIHDITGEIDILIQEACKNLVKFFEI